MARTPSNMLALKSKAQNFNLWDAKSGKFLSLEQLKGKWVL